MSAGPARPRLDRDQAAALCGRLAALSRAGLTGPRAWQVLAAGRGADAEVARLVAGMLVLGGSVPEGLRLAAGRTTGPGAGVLWWLAAVSEVVERAGAPAAAVLDDVAAGVLAEIARADEREVALAGPRATATVLGALPVVGLGLGAAMGANVPAVLLDGPLGWGCAVAGGLLWVAGRFWSARLVAAAARAGG